MKEKELQPDGTWKRPQTVLKRGRMGTAKRRKMREQVNMKKCKYCHTISNLTLDHKIPLIRGGKNEKTNLQCLCMRCNGIKSDLTHKEVKQLFEWHTRVVIEKEANIRKARKEKYERSKNLRRATESVSGVSIREGEDEA